MSTIGHRFQLFAQALAELNLGLAEAPQTDHVKTACVKYFEMAFEHAWKYLQTMLQEEGYTNLSGPRTVLQQAFALGLIEEGRVWMEALSDRNLASHNYGLVLREEIYSGIVEKYAPLLRQFHETHKAARP